MAITPRTAEEASKYILESLEEWKNTSRDKKIISLSNWAEKWRPKRETDPFKKMEEINKSIRDITRSIKRNKDIDLPSPNLEQSLEALKIKYNELVVIHGEPKPKVKKIKTKLPRVELETNSIQA